MTKQAVEAEKSLNTEPSFRHFVFAPHLALQFLPPIYVLSKTFDLTDIIPLALRT